MLPVNPIKDGSHIFRTRDNDNTMIKNESSRLSVKHNYQTIFF